MLKVKNIKFIIFLFLGIFLFKWVYDFFGGTEAVDLINKKRNKLYLLVLAHIPTLYFDSLTWFILLKKRSISFWWSFIITWIAQTSGKFFPTGNVTGEFVRIYLGIKKGLSPHEASSTVFADLILATFSLFIIGLFSFFLVIFKDSSLIDSNYSHYIYFSLILIFFGCIFFYFLIRRRLLRHFIRKYNSIFNVKLNKKTILFFIKLDISLYYLTKRKVAVTKALFFRLIGWLAGAFEIYIFLLIMDVNVSILDVILIESFTGIIRAIAFFVPAGIGVQELAFVAIGSYVGLSPSVSFSIAIGRRVREFLVGVPAIVAWLGIFGKHLKS
jgi:putative membrane protein